MLSDADLTVGCKVKLPAIFNLAKKVLMASSFLTFSYTQVNLPPQNYTLNLCF